jgi:hypothetical protein
MFVPSEADGFIDRTGRATMFNRIFIAAGLAFLATNAPASAGTIVPDGAHKAAAACEAMNAFGPTRVVANIDDGLGDRIVWIKDRDGDVWMCSASARGAVFANTMMKGDLLKGSGDALLGIHTVADSAHGGAAEAQALCTAVGSHLEQMQVITTVEDGLGDYITWLKNADDQLWVCNASRTAKLYDFEAVDLPLNGVAPAELRSA